ATTGALIRVLEKKRRGVRFAGVAFSPDGKHVAAADGTMVSLYDAATGQWLKCLGEHEGPVGGGPFSPDGKRRCGPQVWAAGANTLYLWNTETHALVARLSKHTAMVAALAFRPDGAILATAGDWPDNRVLLWDAATGQLLRELPGHTNSVIALRFSPDG